MTRFKAYSGNKRIKLKESTLTLESNPANAIAEEAPTPRPINPNYVFDLNDENGIDSAALEFDIPDLNSFSSLPSSRALPYSYAFKYRIGGDRLSNNSRYFF